MLIPLCREGHNFSVYVIRACRKSSAIYFTLALRCNHPATSSCKGVEHHFPRVSSVILRSRHESGESLRRVLRLDRTNNSVEDRGSDVSPAAVVGNLNKHEVFERQVVLLGMNCRHGEPPYSCVSREQHPAARAKITVEDYA
jgi:hypothetical protein